MGWLRRKSGTIGVIVGVIIGLGAALYGYFRANRAPLSQREIATRALAEYIGKTAKPKAALIVANPYSQNSGQPGEVYAFQNTSEAGLRRGFGSDVKVKIGYPKLKPEAIRDPTSVFVDPNSATPLSYLLAEDALDVLAKENPDCDVFVSLIGLPANAGASPFWFKPGPPRLALVMPDFKVAGDPTIVRQAFKSGKIIAAVAPKPKAYRANSTAAGKNLEFDKQFVLVTAENVDQLLPLLWR